MCTECIEGEHCNVCKLYDIFILSVEYKKSVNAVNRCLVENQKGATAIQNPR